MNTTVAVSPENASFVSSVAEIALSRIRESKTNPRRTFDETKLGEFGAFVPGNKSVVMWPNRLCGVRVGPFALGGWTPSATRTLCRTRCCGSCAPTRSGEYRDAKYLAMLQPGCFMNPREAFMRPVLDLLPNERFAQISCRTPSVLIL